MFHARSVVPLETYRDAMPGHLYLAHPFGANGQAAQPTSITVVLADSHAGVRRSLRRLLDSAEEVNVVGEAIDLASATREVLARLPRVLVLDLRLPNGSSIDTVARLRRQLPRTDVVMLTMDESPLFARDAFNAGAVGFVLKDRADSELVEAVQRAARGEEYVSPRVAAALDRLRRAVGGDELSPREVEVLRLIALGHTSVEIASQLRLSRRTVETNRASILRKLGGRTRADLVQFALRRGLLWS
jgi:two-component system, NarL family, response regulator NreC